MLLHNQQKPIKISRNIHTINVELRPSIADKDGGKYIFYEIIAFPAPVQIILMKILALNLGERVTSAVTYSPMLPSLAGITLPRTHYTTRVRVIQTTTTTTAMVPYLRAGWRWISLSVCLHRTKGCCLNHRNA